MITYQRASVQGESVEGEGGFSARCAFSAMVQTVMSDQLNPGARAQAADGKEGGESPRVGCYDQ
jgi:hypothetical protein